MANLLPGQELIVNPMGPTFPDTPPRRPVPAFSVRPLGHLGWLLLLLLLGSGCQTLSKAREKTYALARSVVTSSYEDPQASEKLAQAEALFEQGQHRQAQAIFEDLANNTRNPALLAEKARFYEAECLRLREKYPDAAATYHRLLQDYAYGAYREKACQAMYEIAYGWLEEGILREIEADQSGQSKAWYARSSDGFNLFDSKKPLFDTEGEALKVLDNVQLNDSIGPYADKALYWLGYVHYYRGRFEDADHYFSQLVEIHKDSKLRPHAVELAIFAKNNATGGPVYDSTKASEALQLIHHAEALMPGYATDPEKSELLTRQKLAVRMQLATKYLEQARYYERIDKPASAYFYYDLVRRQHPGTKPAEIAEERIRAMEPLKAQAEADRAAGIPPKKHWFRQLNDDWDRVLQSTTKRLNPFAPEEPTPTDPDVNFVEAIPGTESNQPPAQLPNGVRRE